MQPSITAGNSYSQTTVNTQIEGEGKTYTHIETEVNGQKQIFETDEPGRYEIKAEASPTVSPSPLASPEPTGEGGSSTTLIDKIREILATLLSRLFRF